MANTQRLDTRREGEDRQPSSDEGRARDLGALAKDVGRDVSEDRLGIVSAGVAFYAFLALFPALTALISIFGLWANPHRVRQQIQMLEGAVPDSARQLIQQAATRLANASPSSLGWGVALSLLLALWSASKGMRGLVQGVQVAYDGGAKRGIVRETAITLGLTLGGIVLTLVAMAVVVALPPALDALGLASGAEQALTLLRWPIVALCVAGGLCVVYRTARPPGAAGQSQWGARGALLATLLWLVGSVAFSLYVENFGSYDKIYGSVAGVAILLLWFFVSAFAVLLGAEVNARLEEQSPSH